MPPRTLSALVAPAVACLLLSAGPLVAAPLSVSGRVLGPDGESMAGATAFVSSYSTEGRLEVSTGTTDGTGAFSFSVDDARLHGPATVFVFKPGFALAWALVRDGEHADLRLSEQTVTCRGVCVDASGGPLPDATVAVVCVERMYEHHWSHDRARLGLWTDSPLTTTTNDKGAFSIPHLPVGSDVVLEASAPGYERRWRSQVPASADGLRIYLRPEATISGHVRYNGVGVGGVSLEAELGVGYARVETAADGSFTLENLPPGRCAIDFSNMPDGLVADWVADVTLAPGETAENLSITLVEAATVRGVVTASDTGEPIEGVAVYGITTGERAGTSRFWHAFSDGEGRYELRVLPGDLQLFAHHRMEDEPLWIVHGLNRMLSVEAGKTHDGIDFSLYIEPTVTGTITDPEGVPVAGAQVGTINRISHGDVPPRTFFSTRSAEDGKYALQASEGGVRAGYCCWGFVARDTSRGLAGMALPDNVDGPVDIRLQPAAWLLTRVVNRDDEPMPGVPVGLKTADFSERTRAMPAGVSDEEGFVRIGPIPPGVDCAIELGEELSQFFINEHEIGDTVQRLEPGEERQLPPIIFDPRGRSVSGTVVSSEGKPVMDALIVGDGAARPAIAGADGRFTLTGLPKAGMVRIQAVHPTEPLFAGAVVNPDDAAALLLTLKPAAGVSARMLDGDGNPVSGVRISESPSPSPVLPYELLYRQKEAGKPMYGYAGEDGCWTLSGFVGGLDYTLLLSDRKNVFHYQEMTFTAEAGVTTDLGDIILERK